MVAAQANVPKDKAKEALVASNGDIAEALVAKGFEVVKAEVRMPNGPLKTIGNILPDFRDAFAGKC